MRILIVALALLLVGFDSSKYLNQVKCDRGKPALLYVTVFQYADLGSWAFTMKWDLISPFNQKKAPKLISYHGDCMSELKVLVVAPRKQRGKQGDFTPYMEWAVGNIKDDYTVVKFFEDDVICKMKFKGFDSERAMFLIGACEGE